MKVTSSHLLMSALMKGDERYNIRGTRHTLLRYAEVLTDINFYLRIHALYMALCQT